MAKSDQRQSTAPELIDSLAQALKKGRPEVAKETIKPAEPNGHGVPVILQPYKNGLKIICTNKEMTYANLRSLSERGRVEVKVYDKVNGRISKMMPELVAKINELDKPSSKNGSGQSSNNGTLTHKGRAVHADAEQLRSFLESSDDLDALKDLKKVLVGRIKKLLKGKPEKSYKKRVRNGREYWYEVWWDPVEKRKKDQYIGKHPPAHLIERG